jgi:hypothetical protein
VTGEQVAREASTLQFAIAYEHGDLAGGAGGLAHRHAPLPFAWPRSGVAQPARLTALPQLIRHMLPCSATPARRARPPHPVPTPRPPAPKPRSLPPPPGHRPPRRPRRPRQRGLPAVPRGRLRRRSQKVRRRDARAGPAGAGRGALPARAAVAGGRLASLARESGPATRGCACLPGCGPRTQHSTAQHSTARHGTAQHRRAQQSTGRAPRCPAAPRDARAPTPGPAAAAAVRRRRLPLPPARVRRRAAPGGGGGGCGGQGPPRAGRRQASGRARSMPGGAWDGRAWGGGAIPGAAGGSAGVAARAGSTLACDRQCPAPRAVVWCDAPDRLLTG